MAETETKNKKSSKRIWLGVGIAAAVLIVLGIVYFAFSPKATEGAKEITVEVIDSEAAVTPYELNTDAEYLRQAMDELKDQGFTYSGTESEYGIMLDTVNGIRADYEKDGAYWCIMVNGEYGNYGADEQVVTDGDEFQFVYTPAAE